MARGRRFVTLPLLTLEEAQQRLIALTPPLPIERVNVASARGRFLAEALLARRTQPPRNQSAMDGYAVSETVSRSWKILGESAAGKPYEGRLDQGNAVRVSTGALLPEGTSSVILQEDIRKSDQVIELSGKLPYPPEKHVRIAGKDFAKDEILLPDGAELGPAQLALAIAGGHKLIPVRRQPQVTILDSGDELVADPERCREHQIPASNGEMLAAMVASLPCDINQLPPIPDNIDALIDAFSASSASDVIIISGGASVGDHDLVRPALEAWGAELNFWRVAIKPGKPILVATRGKQLVIGLPGNPVSSHVTGYLFLLPVLRAMLGAAAPLPIPLQAPLLTPLKSGGRRREFLRGTWDGAGIAVHANQDSASLTTLAASNILIDRPAHAPAASAGDAARFYLLRSGGMA